MPSHSECRNGRPAHGAYDAPRAACRAVLPRRVRARRPRSTHRSATEMVADWAESARFAPPDLCRRDRVTGNLRWQLDDLLCTWGGRGGVDKAPPPSRHHAVAGGVDVSPPAVRRGLAASDGGGARSRAMAMSLCRCKNVAPRLWTTDSLRHCKCYMSKVSKRGCHSLAVTRSVLLPLALYSCAQNGAACCFFSCPRGYLNGGAWCCSHFPGT